MHAGSHVQNLTGAPPGQMAQTWASGGLRSCLSSANSLLCDFGHLPVPHPHPSLFGGHFPALEISALFLVDHLPWSGCGLSPTGSWFGDLLLSVAVLIEVMEALRSEA